MKAPTVSDKIVPNKVSRKHKNHERSPNKARTRGSMAANGGFTKDHIALSEEDDILKSEMSGTDPSLTALNASLSSPTRPCHPLLRQHPDHESVQQAIFYPISTNALPAAPLTWFLSSGAGQADSLSHLSQRTAVSSSSNNSRRPSPSLNQSATVSVSSPNLSTNPRIKHSSRSRASRNRQSTLSREFYAYSSPSAPSSACFPKDSLLEAGLSVPIGPPSIAYNNARNYHHMKYSVAIEPAVLEPSEKQTAASLANSNTAGMHAYTSLGDAKSADDFQKLDASIPLSPPESSATGRLSLDAEKALANCFGELDCAISKARTLTGLSTKQIIKRWQPSNTRSSNLWNIYQKYFHTRPEEELGRLREKNSKGSAQVCMKSIKAAYKAFQKAEPNFKSILEVFRRIHDIDGSNTTVNGRWREFLKYVNTVKRLAESASTINGFEIAFCAVGSVVQQDQSLSATYCSPMVESFFSDRLRLSDNEIEGHLKAHAYDHASRAALSNGNDESDISPLIASRQPAAKSTALPGSSEIKSKKRRLLKDLKEKFLKLLGPCKLSQVRPSHLPFSDIPKILAENGWILENWPEDVPFPCDFQKGKGIASMRACYRDSLLKAFDDRSYPVKVIKKYLEAVPPSEPVIVGIPPVPDSKYARGRRRFLDKNQTVDRNGPARRIESAVMGREEGEREDSQQAHRKRRDPCQGKDIDQAHPRKRRKGK